MLSTLSFYAEDIFSCGGMCRAAHVACWGSAFCTKYSFFLQYSRACIFQWMLSRAELLSSISHFIREVCFTLFKLPDVFAESCCWHFMLKAEAGYVFIIYIYIYLSLSFFHLLNHTLFTFTFTNLFIGSPIKKFGKPDISSPDKFKRKKTDFALWHTNSK